MKLAYTLVIALALAAVSAYAGKASDKRAFMAPIYQNLRVLLPLTVPHTQLQSPDHETTVRHALENLADNADALAAHVKTDEPGNRVLGQSVAAEAKALAHDWRRGRSAETAYGLQQLTRLCVACHSKLPSDSSPLSQGFLDDTRLSRLPADERAELLLATRQFDEALLAYESFFRDPSVHPTKMLAPLTDYLVASVRVKGDYERPAQLLRSLTTRGDAWSNLKADLFTWQADLARFAKKPPAPTLSSARALVEEARQLSRYPADRRPLVRWIAASSALHQLLERGGLEQRAAAEAYLLLTLAEARVEQDFFLPSADAYLSSCVKLAPHTDVAERCYSLLEEQTVLGYTGTGAHGLPEDVEQRLMALEKLAAPR